MRRVIADVAIWGAAGDRVGIADGRIAWLGTAPAGWEAVPVTRYGGRLLTPALVDCHTHLVYAGDRAREWEMRLEGASYAAIAKAGGGILSTMQAVRAAAEDALLAESLPRLDALLAEGVGTVEIKSGYGLSIADEIKMLRVARRLGAMRPVRVVTSWLAAHAVPPEYRGRADAYIDEVAIPGLAEAHAQGLVDAVDGFCEGIAFSPAQIARVFEAAQALGLPLKLHADQLSDLGGGALAARFGALSADHVEYLSAAGITAMAEAGTVAVLLPGAFYMLRETQAPPVAGLRAAAVPMAVATDANPGSSPLLSPLLAMNMACTLFGLTPQEAMAGVTQHAAQALGVETGRLVPGAPADLAIWEAASPAHLANAMGHRPLHLRIHGGADV
ncbi:MAG: imidazolonepropionase [Pseudomonadota bacterium]